MQYPGSPFPLGATYYSNGVNFALYTENATKVELCLFDNEEDTKETTVVELTSKTGHIWHVFLPGIKAGQLYGYRVDGPYEPASGHRFNKNKLLIDPMAKAIMPQRAWDKALYGYELGNGEEDLSYSNEDSAPFMPRCMVVEQRYDWEDDKCPKIPWHKTIVYELHVKGFTMLHPRIPENIRGKYAALAHPETTGYLKALGITAVELMPVHYFPQEQSLADKGLANYWGYNTLGFFAPDTRYAVSPANVVNEFKDMVKALHKEGIEVILDVVYNHTAEGNQLGPTLSFKGIDNSVYYRLADDKRYYKDYTGTGNTLNARLPAVLRLIMDSLRYWIQEMHVDGFRFDLAATLARGLHEVDRLGSFLDIIYQDPVISQVKLIAEPWDVGEGGYQVGNFPPGWSEWNGKYRDCIRDFWRGADRVLNEFPERFTGSPDLYKDDSRSPTASINFITAHDGFTLADLVAYNEKHNEQNGEDNNDGESNNRSWNCGAEGATDDPEVLKLRQRQQRNFLTTLFLSIGVPMLRAGDETGKTQHGNNNAYCQDNEISWMDWAGADMELLKFTQQLTAMVKHPVFCRKGWFQGQKIRGGQAEDIAWFRPDGNQMVEEDWNNGFTKSLGVFLNGKGIKSPGPKGEQITDDNFYIIFNAHFDNIDYTLPPQEYGTQWQMLIDTAQATAPGGKAHDAGGAITVSGRSTVVFINKQA